MTRTVLSASIPLALILSMPLLSTPLLSTPLLAQDEPSESASWSTESSAGDASADHPAAELLRGEIVDLTHAYDADTIYWPTEDGFRLEVGFKGETEKGYHYEANSFTSAEHGGTHLDAPIHFAADRQTVDEIPLDRLIGPAVVVDVREASAKNRDHQVSVADLKRHEKTHGRIPDDAIVLLDTGSARFWPDRERYMGTAERGAEAVAKLHFPGLHPDAAQWLVDERDIAAIGLDTPSIDYGQSTLYESHRILFDRNISAFENVANLDALPPTGATVIALPMKIRGGSGGPLRIVAIVPPSFEVAEAGD